MDIVTGKTRPDLGSVTFVERAISLLKLTKAGNARADIGRKFQRPTVFEDQTDAENPMQELKAARSPWRALIWQSSAAQRARIDALAAQVGLGDHLAPKSGERSHGQKQWLEIAMLLAQEPRLFLVDEPAAGMTPAERERTTELLIDIARTRAVVVVEHAMEFVRRLNCRVTVLHEGRVLAEGSLDHVTEWPMRM